MNEDNSSLVGIPTGASVPSLRSVSRPVRPWLPTHTTIRATRVLWHGEGMNFFKRFLALSGVPVAYLWPSVIL